MFLLLQETMKAVISGEMETVVREEKFLKEEPERLENALRRCKKLTGTLVTLKRSVINTLPPTLLTTHLPMICNRTLFKWLKNGSTNSTSSSGRQRTWNRLRSSLSVTLYFPNTNQKSIHSFMPGWMLMTDIWRCLNGRCHFTYAQTSAFNVSP